MNKEGKSWRLFPYIGYVRSVHPVMYRVYTADVRNINALECVPRHRYPVSPLWHPVGNGFFVWRNKANDATVSLSDSVVVNVADIGHCCLRAGMSECA